MTKYVVFCENNFDDLQSWYSFIKIEGNEKNLRHLKHCVDAVDWGEASDDCSSFALDMNGVSAETAEEMCNVELDNWYRHRKFDGTLRKIPITLKDRDSDEKKAWILSSMLAGNNILEFIDGHDFDKDESDGSDGSDGSRSSRSSQTSESDYYSSEDSEDATADTRDLPHDSVPPILRPSHEGVDIDDLE